MNSTMKLFVLLSCVILLQGCVHRLVTVPVKVAYKTTKGAVKGTAVVVGAVIPDGEEDAQNEDQDEQD
ncbi:MAG: NF038104 family lipoprotein [Acinetobacter sp.]|nr:NF038104 family lipoprotein [Acinetobacter sp.]